MLTVRDGRVQSLKSQSLRDDDGGYIITPTRFALACRSMHLWFFAHYYICRQRVCGLSNTLICRDVYFHISPYPATLFLFCFFVFLIRGFFLATFPVYYKRHRVRVHMYTTHVRNTALVERVKKKEGNVESRDGALFCYCWSLLLLLLRCCWCRSTSGESRHFFFSFSLERKATAMLLSCIYYNRPVSRDPMYSFGYSSSFFYFIYKYINGQRYRIKYIRPPPFCIQRRSRDVLRFTVSATARPPHFFVFICLFPNGEF